MIKILVKVSIILSMSLLSATFFQSCSTDGDDPGFGLTIPDNPAESDSPNSDGSSGGNAGGTTSYEAPEIYYSDFTAGTSSLSVTFIIGNKDRTKVTSAKGYYGSKTTTCNVGSAVIYANFSGLKKGTKYKVYCVATGPGGTGTSETVTVQTLSM